MRDRDTLRLTLRLICLLLAAGCDSGGKAAAPPDLALLPDLTTASDATLPSDAHFLVHCVEATVAADPVILSGAVVDVNRQPLAGVTLELHGTDGHLIARAADADGGTAGSAADGSITITIPTGGKPVEGYFVLQGSETPRVTFFPRASLSASLTSLAWTIPTRDQLQAMYTSVGATYDARLGTIASLIVRCDGTALVWASGSTSPAAAKIVYGNGSSMPSPSAGSVGNDAVFFALGVPPGTVSASAVFQDQTLPARALTVEADALTVLNGLRP